MGKKSQNVLLDINPEGDLLREIKDIIDEISIMIQIKKQEENVTRTFLKQVQNLLQKPEPGPPGNNRSDSGFPSPNSPYPRSSPTPRSNYPTWSDFEWTMMSANELAEGIQNQLRELGYLKEAADNASLGVSSYEHTYRGILTSSS